MSFEHTEHCIFILSTIAACCWHTAIGYVQNKHPINALNPICLYSFRIQSAQSSWCRC